jgi:hypothetical protein
MERKNSWFFGLATPATSAPRMRASCTAAEPVPPDAPSTSARCPAASPAAWNACSEVSATRGERRRLRERSARRHRREITLRHTLLLGVRAALDRGSPDVAEDLVAQREAPGAVAPPDDLAREIPAGDEGQSVRKPLREIAAHDLPVDRVHAGCADLHHILALARAGVGHLVEHHRLVARRTHEHELPSRRPPNGGRGTSCLRVVIATRIDARTFIPRRRAHSGSTRGLGSTWIRPQTWSLLGSTSAKSTT